MSLQESIQGKSPRALRSYLRRCGLVSLLSASLLLLSLAPVSISTAVAEDDEFPVLVVDVPRVLKESIAGKAASNDMEGERKKQELILSKLRNEVANEDAALEKQSALLSSAALQEKQDALGKKKQELSRKLHDAEAELMKQGQQRIKKVLDQVDLVVKKLAEERKGKFVLDYDPRVVIYASDRIQITEEVLERLDEMKIDS